MGEDGRVMERRSWGLDPHGGTESKGNLGDDGKLTEQAGTLPQAGRDWGVAQARRALQFDAVGLAPAVAAGVVWGLAPKPRGPSRGGPIAGRGSGATGARQSAAQAPGLRKPR